MFGKWYVQLAKTIELKVIFSLCLEDESALGEEYPIISSKATPI